jgi:hypothetical protein
VEHLLHGLAHPGLLGVSVTVGIGVIPLRRLFEVVGLSSPLTHGEDLLDASLSIGTGEVSLAQKEAHHVVELRLRVHDQVLKSNE